MAERPIADIVALYQERKKAQGPLVDRMRELLRHYEGDIAVPLPEMGSDREEKVAVANLLAQGIDQHGMRIASTTPDVWFPPLREGIKSSQEKARRRRKASLGWLEHNAYDLLAAQRARWLIAYASTPVVIRPCPVKRIPVWCLYSPLDTFAPPRVNGTDMTPADCIFAYTRTLSWLKRNYPAQSSGIVAARSGPGGNPRWGDEQVEVVEYVDGDEIVLCATAGTDTHFDAGERGLLMSQGPGSGLWRWVTELERTPNRAGLPPAVVPGRISLGEPKGQFDDMIGLFQQQAKLMAMEVNAVAESIWPATWFVEGQTGGEIVTVADGPRGVVGHVKGGEVKLLQSTPGFQTYPTIDRLERAQRQEGGIPAEFGGESPTNIRTGRRGDAVISAVIDFPIQEAHKILARSAQAELERAIEVDKAYFGTEAKSFYVSWRGAKGFLDYTPNDTFEDGAVVTVRYPAPGSDINGLIIRNGQRLGIGLISKRTAREQDPEIDDPETEADRVVAEGVLDALLSSIQSQAADPAGPYQPVDLALLVDLVLSNKMELAAAVMEVQKRAQQRQATPAEPTAPEAQPGLSPPGAGAEAPLAPPQVAPGVSHLSQLMSQLRRPQMTLPSERPVEGAA